MATQPSSKSSSSRSASSNKSSNKSASSAATRLHAVAFNCTLKGSRGKEKSSTEVLLQQLLEALESHGVTSEIIRAVDHNILPGVEHNEGRGDDWPKLLKRLLAADIVVLGTPIWL